MRIGAAITNGSVARLACKPCELRGEHGLQATRARRRNRGLTLIEILMVVIILGISSAIVIPQISSRNDLKAASAARAIVADILYAQNQAIVTQANQYMKFNTVGQTYKVCTGYSPEVVATNPQTLMPFVKTFSTAAGTSATKDMRIGSAVFDGEATLGFDPLGAPLCVKSDGSYTAMISGSVVVQAGTFSMTITISPYTGELTVN